MVPDKFGTSFADRSRELDRFNLCSRVILKLMVPSSATTRLSTNLK
jgi:hypothetical protein